uniref:Aquaporin n=1 Tax=Panagrellus redivivus TaxID=6233 RepID=A0A7E4ZVC4_PANRE
MIAKVEIFAKKLFKEPWQTDTIMPIDDDLEIRPYRLWHKLAAEFIGTCIFVFIGTMSMTNGGGSLVTIAMAHGFTIFILVASLGHISGGHFNPAVSTGVALAGKLPPVLLPLYAGTQLLGGIAGAAICRACTTHKFYMSGIGGATLLNTDITWGEGLVTEIMLTAILVHVVLNTAVDTATNVLAPLAIGLTLSLDICGGGPITGASMNPARSLGPNLMAWAFIDFDIHPELGVTKHYLWNYHWVYYVGPLIGAALAAGLFRTFFSRRSRVI